MKKAISKNKPQGQNLVAFVLPIVTGHLIMDQGRKRDVFSLTKMYPAFICNKMRAMFSDWRAWLFFYTPIKKFRKERRNAP